MADTSSKNFLVSLNVSDINRNRILLPTFLLVVLLAVWQLFIEVTAVSPTILPSPMALPSGMVNIGVEPVWITFQTILIGFLIGGTVGLVLGILMGVSEPAYLTLSPYAFMTQAIPIVAIAPTILLILGLEMSTNYYVTAILVFFPVAINVARGFKDIDPVYDKYRRSINMGRLEYLMKIQIRKSARPVFTGLKLGVTLATIGGVVSEYINPAGGLGTIVLKGRGEIIGTTLMFAGVILIAALGMTFYLTIQTLEKRLITW